MRELRLGSFGLYIKLLAIATDYDRFPHARTSHRSGAFAQGQAAGHAQSERPAPRFVQCWVAELDPSPLWNQATIGVVSVSHSRDYLDGLMKNVERAATRIANNAGAEVTDSFVEFL
jgi:hypothetical protein